MSAQQVPYTRDDMADFSSALKQASTFGHGAEKYKSRKEFSKTKAQLHEEYNPYNNRNLSSDITRIRDDGPATSPQNNHVDLSESTHTKSGAAGTDQQVNSRPATMRPGTDENHQTSEYLALDDSDHYTYTAQRRNTVWQQFVLILLVSVISVMGFLLYQLKMQSDEMKEVMRLNEENHLLNSDAQKNSFELTPRLASMNEELVELRHELKAIKTDYQASDNKLAVNIPRKLEQQLKKIAVTSANVNALQNDFDHIQGQVQEMGTEIRVIKNEIVPEKTQRLTNSWVVNLAALSSKDKAQLALDKLHQSAASPLMQEVVVDGKKMYRISAEGFSTPEEAAAFITEAKEKYGFDGGWIHQI